MRYERHASGGFGVYVLRDSAGVVRRVMRVTDTYTIEGRRPLGWSVELAYQSHIPAEAAVMQRHLAREHGIGKRPGAGAWPSHVASPTREELLAAERRLGVDAGLDRRQGLRARPQRDTPQLANRAG